MRQPIYLFIGLCLLVFNALQAQKTTLQGIVTDQSTEDPLYPATVKVGDIGTITDIDGRFQLDLDGGEYTLEVSYVGYKTYNSTIELSTNTPKTLNISLSEIVNLLQTATVTTSKYEKPLSEATVSLEVLRSNLIESTNAINIDQALEKIPGVNIIGGQPNIRGGSGFSYGAGSRVLILVNDLPALQADAGTPNFGDLPIESIEQVEIVKGAASALYGSAALNGIFNIRTAYARSKPETRISLFGGIFSAPKDKEKKWWEDGTIKYETGLLLSHKQKINKFDLVVSGRLYTSEDPREGFANDRGRASLGIRYRFSDKFYVGFNSTYNKQKNQAYFFWLNAEEGIYRGSQTIGTTRPARYYIDPFLSYYDNGGNRHKFTGRFYSIDNNADERENSNFSDQYYGEYQFQRRFKEQDLITTAGLVGSRTNVTAPIYGDTSYVLTNAAFYLQLEKKIGDRLNLSGGFRYEYNKLKGPQQVDGIVVPNEGVTTDSRPIFRFGLNYKVQENTFLRASWGQGFRFPTIAEKFVDTETAGFPVFANPQLESETGSSSEIAIKQGFEISEWQGYLDIAAFRMEYDNMIEFDIGVRTLPNGLPQVGFQAQNVGSTVINGVDFSLAGEGSILNIPISILAGYTYINPKFKEFTQADSTRSSVDYNILKYRFKHSIKADVEGTFGPLKLGIALIRNSHIEAIDNLFEKVIVPGLARYRAENNNGYYVWNTRISYQISKPLKASFLVRNLFNAEYGSQPGLLEPTRLWSLRTDYVF